MTSWVIFRDYETLPQHKLLFDSDVGHFWKIRLDRILGNSHPPDNITRILPIIIDTDLSLWEAETRSGWFARETEDDRIFSPSTTPMGELHDLAYMAMADANRILGDSNFY